MRRPNIVNDIGSWMLENGHRTLLKLSGGRFPKKMIGMQPVELFTIGRKTGERRGTLLTAPICEDDRIVVVASKGGHEHHPQWYKNLAVNPEVEVANPIGAPARPMRARTASPEEKAALWPTITKANPGYEGYQRNTDRDIPVVICEPR
jgi:deazaflavin-dependent oxidoreductase (nitroreductase family)